VTSSHRTAIFALTLVVCASTAFAQKTDDAKAKPTSEPAWKEYAYPAYRFAITVPQEPKETLVKSGSQYRLYWDEDAKVVINLVAERGPTDCSAWLAWANSTFKHAGPKDAFKYRPPALLSVFPVVASSRVVTIDGSPALEAEAPRNTLQAGYQRHQCSNSRLYHLEAGWPKGQNKPPIVGRVLNSFRVLTEESK
jgi:hypothetical protein